MGWGDEVLVTGESYNAHRKDEKQRSVTVLDRRGRPRWSPLWQGCTWIAIGLGRHKRETIKITNGPRCRPYIDYHRMEREFRIVYPGRRFTTKVNDEALPYRFTGHRVRIGRLPFVKARRKPGFEGFTVIEPHYKPRQTNRDWGWHKWQMIVNQFPDRDWVQINPPGARLLQGVRHIPAPTFMDACLQLSHAALFVGPEGGLYHAAVALGRPCVAIFGGFVSPANQGYDLPTVANLYEAMGDKSPCGQRVPCAHCQVALSRITIEMVIDAIERVGN